MKKRTFLLTMTTKICLSLAMFLIQTIVLFSEEKPSVTAMLEQKYAEVAFKSKGGIEYYYLFNERPRSEDPYVGIADANGNVIVPCVYAFADIEGLPNHRYKYYYKTKHFWSVYDFNGNCGIVDANGNILIPCKYDGFANIVIYYDITFFANMNDGRPAPYGYAFEMGDKIKCLFDENGKEIIPLSRGYDKFDLSINPVGGTKTIKVFNNNKEGLCDIDGTELLPPIYNQIFNLSPLTFNETRYLELRLDAGEGLYDYKKKRIAVSPRYFDVSAHANVYYIQAEKDGIYKIYYDDTMITTADKVWGKGRLTKDDPYNKYTKFKKGNKYGLINDITGKLLPLNVDSIIEITESNVSAMNNGSMILYGLADLESNRYESIASISQGQLINSTSDVDVNIPQIKKQNENTFAVIVANENYNNFIVPAASNDGQVFKEYCNKALGIPSENILYYKDATINNIYAAIKRLKDLADVYDEGCKIIFYYSGQGVTDEQTKKMYLLPTDGTLKAVSSTCYSVSKLYSEIGTLPNVEQSLFLIDASFNGMTRENKPLQVSRGVAIKSIPNTVAGKTIAVEAASEGETAHVYISQNHGLFTYYLLKALQTNSSNKAITDILPEIVTNVKTKSTEELKIVQNVQIKK